MAGRRRETAMTNIAATLAVNRALAELYRTGDIAPIYEKWFGSMRTAGALIGAMYLINSLPE